MTPKRYIEENLTKLHGNFPQMGIRYAFDADINTHLIELLPLDEYNNNQELDNAWFKIYHDFTAIFPDDEIAFFSSDSLLSIDSEVLLDLKPIYKSEKEVLSHLYGGEQIGKASLPTGKFTERASICVHIARAKLGRSQKETAEKESADLQLYPFAA